jgi:hypothetical protein
MSGLTANYAEIDIEGKQNVSVHAEMKLGIATVGTKDLTAAEFGGSDNGPDNSASNNQRLIVGSLNDASAISFDSIVLSVLPVGGVYQGSFSLEGGSDGASASDLSPAGPLGQSLSTRDTIFRLGAPADGELDCAPPNNVATESGVTVRRALSNLNGVPCELKPYSLSRTGDTITFLVDGSTQQAAYVADIAWTPIANNYPTATHETSVDIPAPTHPMKWCVRTPTFDGNGELIADSTSNPILPTGEVACVYHQSWSVFSSTQIQLTESIYFEGDIIFTKSR